MRTLNTDLRITGTTIFDVPICYKLTFSAGKGRVIIDTQTGQVTIEGCELPEAAQAFWKAVEAYCPKR